MTMSKAEPRRLENWTIRQGCLLGQVFGDPNRPAGTWIETSSITQLDGNEVQTRNSRYSLGNPDPAFLLASQTAKISPEAALYRVAFDNSLRR